MQDPLTSMAETATKSFCKSQERSPRYSSRQASRMLDTYLPPRVLYTCKHERVYLSVIDCSGCSIWLGSLCIS